MASEQVPPVVVATGGATPPERLTDEGAHFDWYQCTIRADLDVVLDVFTRTWGLTVHDGTPRYSYTHGYDLKGDDGVAVNVLHGGNGGGVHCWASGHRAEPFAALVREQWPDDHHVTRMDSRIDFRDTGDAETLWTRLYDQCLDLAAWRTKDNGERVKRARPIQTRHYGDYVEKVRGRTLYMGSPKADALVRLYEKGKQMRGQSVKPDTSIPLDWCRLEVQVRPKKQARARAAHLSPLEVWGMAVWTRDLLHVIEGIEVTHEPLDVWRETNDERALMWLAHQYGPTLDRLAEANGGDWSKVFDLVSTALDNRPKPDALRLTPRGSNHGG